MSLTGVSNPPQEDKMKNMDLTMIPRRAWLSAMGVAVLASVLPGAWAADMESPEALIQRVAGELIEQVKTDKAIQAGDLAKVVALVDAKIMPHVNFTRMTASAVGRFWRQATPEQKQRLQDEFKTLLVRTYAGALSQLKDQTLTLRPSRYRPEDTEVVVRSEVRGKGEPVQLDYRLEKTAAGWKVYDLNVLGVWLVETYRGQFAQEINARGIDGLIAALAERNRSNAANKAG
jgi:phospholipid transport system substrate-binding protein